MRHKEATTQRIKRKKDKLIEEARNRLQNMDGGSIEQMGQIIDMIKDLSEAEKACLEAEYYDSVIDAMENGQRYGYDDQGGNTGGAPRLPRAVSDGQ